MKKDKEVTHFENCFQAAFFSGTERDFYVQFVCPLLQSCHNIHRERLTLCYADNKYAHV